MHFKNLILPFLSVLEAIMHLHQADLIFFHQGTYSLCKQTQSLLCCDLKVFINAPPQKQQQKV